MAALFWIAWQLAQPILLILAGIVFAALLDGGTRLLGRVLKIGRGWRLLIICLSALLGIVGIFDWMGVEIVQQAAQLRETIVEKGQRVIAWLEANGIMQNGAQPSNLGSQLFGSLGRLKGEVGRGPGARTRLV